MMTRTERLWKILREDYGITTRQQLDEAIAKLPKLDITIFVMTPEEWKAQKEKEYASEN